MFDDIEKTYLERGQPRERYDLSGRYRQGPWAVQLRFNMFGAVQSTESRDDPARKQTFSSKWITSLDLSRRFGKTTRIAIGAANLFDVLPDENIEANSFHGIFILPRRTAPFGLNGGYYYVNLGFDL